MSSTFAREIVDVPVGEEMSESFLAYSLSVITSRAIPDVRDGLKPVQRRILYSMLRMGLRPDSSFRKCAHVVGDVMGSFHPHGDGAIYDALVRLGQPFARVVPMVQPHGNFGSLDDPPAAYRYTECRLTEAAMEMVREIDEDTVEFRPTYDGESTEPEYLPALLPNLLVNGTSGIAVGMATNMPTHNLAEVQAAIELVMTKRRPKPTIDELLAVLPGPDFPSGGIVIADGLREAYESGRGTVRMRARTIIEKVTRARSTIVVTELPYLVGPEKVVKRVNELVVDGKLPGVADARNLSDRKNGLRIQIDCKAGANPEAVLAELYRQTPLEETFGINNVVLVDGVPRTLGLYDLCRHHVEHRLDVVVRRTQHRLDEAEARLHVVEGLLIALDAIDQVVAIIRGSADAAEAREELVAQLGLSEIQANHILDMQLRRLTALERQKLVDERDDLVERIDDYRTLLGSEKRQRRLVLDELAELVEAFAVERRTEIVAADDLPDLSDAPAFSEDVPDTEAVVALSTSGVIGRAPTQGGKRALPGRHDVLTASIVARTRGQVVAVTSDGRALTAPVHELPEVGGRTRGSPADKAFALNKGETVRTIVAPPVASEGDDGKLPLGLEDDAEKLVLVTAGGVVKRVDPAELTSGRSGKPVINLKGNDKVVAAFTCPEEVDVVVVASDGQALRTPAAGISVQGRAAAGVAGMRLKDGAVVVAAGPVIGDPVVVTVTDDGAAKATPAAEIPTKGRGGAGVRLVRFGKGQRAVELAHVGALEGLLAVMATDDDPTKPDPTPVAVTLEPTGRDLTGDRTDRRILDLGPARW